MKTMEEFINFWVNGVLTSVVVVCGIFLNSISIHIIWKKYSKIGIFYQMLLRLLCIDICVLVTWFVFSLYGAFKVKQIFLLYIIAYGIYPLIHVALSASTFMTIAISHERYRAVKFPIRYTEEMKAPHVVTRRLFLYTITVIFLSVVYNFSYFFELKVKHVTISKHCDEKLQSANSTTLVEDAEIVEKITNLTHGNISNFKAALERTELGKNEDYLKYYRFITRLMISGIIPFVVLIYFNIEILRAIKKNNRLRRRLAVAQPLSRLVSVQSTRCESLDSGPIKVTNSMLTATSKQEQKRQQEDNLAKLFVVMVVAFLCCNSLKFALNFYDGINVKHKVEEWYRIISFFSNILVLINSSMNMGIYCIMNIKFRKDLIELCKSFMPTKQAHRSSIKSRHTSGTTR